MRGGFSPPLPISAVVRILAPGCFVRVRAGGMIGHVCKYRIIYVYMFLDSRRGYLGGGGGRRTRGVADSATWVRVCVLLGVRWCGGILRLAPVMLTGAVSVVVPRETCAVLGWEAERSWVCAGCSVPEVWARLAAGGLLPQLWGAKVEDVGDLRGFIYIRYL